MIESLQYVQIENAGASKSSTFFVVVAVFVISEYWEYIFFAVDHPHMWFKKKNLIAHQKEGVDGTKKVQLADKKVQLGTT